MNPHAGVERMEPSTTLVVVVSYNVAPLLARCLESIRQAGESLAGQCERLDVVVVDNASTDGSAELVRARFPEVRLIVNARNLGFGAACNQGAAADADYVLFLNPDAALTPGALPALLARVRSTPRAGMAGPRVTYSDGRPQPTRRRFPTLGALLLESTPLEWRRPGWGPLRRYHMADRPAYDAAPVDWLSGACLLARKAAFDEAGGFSPSFFMYFEEVDLSRRMAAYGWQTWYEPDAHVVHHHSRSADQDLLARDRHYYGSKYRYVARYWGGAVARGLSLFTTALFAAELTVRCARRDAAGARRYGALVRWHLLTATLATTPPGAAESQCDNETLSSLRCAQGSP